MNQRLIGLVGLLGTALVISGGVAWAGQPTDEELAKKVEQLESEIVQLKTGGEGGSWLSEAMEKVAFHGYVGQGFLYSTENNYLFSETKDGDFQFNEMGFNMYAKLSKKVSIGIQLFSRDLGLIGNNAIALDYAFGDYHFSDALGLRAGRIRIPWGLYGETRDVDVARTSVFMPQSVYREQERDVAYGIIGFGFYGLIPLGGGGGLEYEAQTGSQNIDYENSAVGRLMFESSWTQPGVRTHHGTHYTGRLIWNTPLDGLRVGGSYFFFDEMTGTGRTSADPYLVDVLGVPAGSDYTMTLVDVTYGIAFAELTAGDLIIAAEYVRTHAAMEDTIWQEMGLTQMTTRSDGGYLSARYRFNSWFELGSYYSMYWPNRDDRDGDSYAVWGWPDYQAWSKDLALSLRFDAYKGVLFKLEGHYMDGTANLSNSVNESGTTKKNAYLFATKLSYTF